MLTRAQIEQYIKEIPSDTDPDERRAAYATITGYSEDKSINEIVSYYSLNKDSVIKWMSHFDFASTKSDKSGRRTSKTKMIEEYLAKNVGAVVNFTKVAEELNISTPTVYNFYNANRAYFKKVSRGNFEILDPKAERTK